MISTRNVLISAAAMAAAANALTVVTPPSMVQCQPVQLAWSDGVAPFYVAIIPGNQPTAAALEQLDIQQGTSVTWMVDLAAGQDVTIKVTDSTGAIQYSSAVPIQTGSSTECTSSGGSDSASTASSAESDVASDSSSSSSDAATLAITRSPLASSTSSSVSLAFTPSSSAAASAKTSATSAIAAAAAAATTPATTGAASTSAKAGLGMLVGGLLLALAA